MIAFIFAFVNRGEEKCYFFIILFLIWVKTDILLKNYFLDTFSF